MNNEPIKRIDAAIRACEDDTPILKKTLTDCKAEIELLTTINASLRSQNESLDDECARLEAENDTLSKPYVPMTDDEIPKMIAEHFFYPWQHMTDDGRNDIRSLAQSIMNRLGVAPKESL